jgi:hypothetical protein
MRMPYITPDAPLIPTINRDSGVPVTDGGPPCGLSKALKTDFRSEEKQYVTRCQHLEARFLSHERWRYCHVV